MNLPGVRRASIFCVSLLAITACPSDPAADEGTSADSTGAMDSTGDGMSDDGDPNAGGEIAGCGADSCVMLLVSQTLDDRVEVFVPDHAEGAYRGAVDLDLKPNTCDGCGPGDNNDGRLDEPFGLTRAGGFLHILVGHYPSREEGSVLSLPLSMLEGYAGGSTVPVADYFADGAFLAPAIGRSLGEVEPIFMSTHASGRVLVGVFNNDLFATEDTWTQPGKLLVLDPSDPGGEVGEVTLDDLDGGPCNGAAQVLDLGGDRLGVACDGNEAVAILDASAIGEGTVVDAAASLGSGAVCSIPGALPGRRVRYLAPDGSGGFLVAEGPTPLDLLGGGKLWHINAACEFEGTVTLPPEGDWQLGEVVRLPADIPTWLFAAGSASPDGLRGVFVAHEASGTLETCGPIAGFETHWEDPDGEPLEPFALAVTQSGSHLAVGAGPFVADSDAVGYGKVLWASLSGSDPCSLSADVIDLTDGAAGHAPAPTTDDASTFRRAPNVVTLLEL